ncbi:hypothetical protein ACN27G_27640 [Plantactinospora sp. WMMB334]|uniref:hypothetical protein n=1 Tax=Plantactinospora sp. WMMB334 TaxID=3404119 RepID=UPI003B92B554
MGRYAVRDPDDDGRWTYWRVEAVGRSRRELRPWPPDVRWYPNRPPYPADLPKEQRAAWRQEWYDRVYFGWKEAVVAAIAADPQAAADAFAEHAPSAVLPERRKPRRRKPEPWERRVAPSSRKRADDRILAAALKLAGLSFAEVGRVLDLPKTTAIRRVVETRQRAEVPDLLARASVAVEIVRLQDRLFALCRLAEDGELTAADQARIQELTVRLDALRAVVVEDPSAGRRVFEFRAAAGGSSDGAAGGRGGGS